MPFWIRPWASTGLTTYFHPANTDLNIFFAPSRLRVRQRSAVVFRL